jgi:hypothetical protein
VSSPTRTHRFPIELGRRSRPFLRLFFGVTPERAYVEVDGELVARFGFGHVRTPVANIVRWRIEGPWRWITAIGIRRSIRHGDLTFGGSHRGGVRVDFRERVEAMGFRIPAFYVTVEDADGFGAALSELGIPGEDARRSS